MAFGFKDMIIVANLAMKMAKETGIGWVAAKGSNHFGICQWYVFTSKTLSSTPTTLIDSLIVEYKNNFTMYNA